MAALIVEIVAPTAAIPTAAAAAYLGKDKGPRTGVATVAAANRGAIPAGTLPCPATSTALILRATVASKYFVVLAVAALANFVTAGSATPSAAGQATLLRTITNGIDSPRAIAADVEGHLYVGNVSRTVTEYGSRGKTLIRTLSHNLRSVIAPAFDPKGNLYVASGIAGENPIKAYAPGRTNSFRTLHVAGPESMAFDHSGNLYAGTANSVVVFAPKNNTPIRTITDGIGYARALAFDSAGNLYVANNFYYSVTVYAPGSSSALYKITQGVPSPMALAFDGAGNLYVGIIKPA